MFLGGFLSFKCELLRLVLRHGERVGVVKGCSRQTPKLYLDLYTDLSMTKINPGSQASAMAITHLKLTETYARSLLCPPQEPQSALWCRFERPPLAHDLFALERLENQIQREELWALGYGCSHADSGFDF